MSGRLFAQHDMTAMATGAPLGVSHSRLGSGTSWLPDSSPMRAATGMWGNWSVSLHGSAYGQYDDQFTKRGDQQIGVTDWEMAMAMRPVSGGLLQLHVMTSVEPLVLGGGGYPQLLQTGGTFQHAVLHDRQHPHDAIMELAAMYEHSVMGSMALSVYAGAVGEPALGPVAFMHRPSAESDPVAPLGHHWQDAAHQSFGVVTLGLSTGSVKLEGSLFNPREPDENHLLVDYREARLDSYAGRLSWAATPRVVASAWWAYLNSHDRLDPTMRMHRYGASVITELRGPGGGQWASTFIWGTNLHHHGAGSHELLHAEPGASPHHRSSSQLVESNLKIGPRSAVFARIERVQKNGEELGFLGGDLTTLYDIRSIVAGFTHQIASVGSAEFALGARGGVNFVPSALLPTYGTRTPAGYAVYTQLRPRR